MSRFHHVIAVAALAIAGGLFTTPVVAQQPGRQGALVRDLSTLSDKYTGLARVMAGKYDWRPAPGVRSVGDVFNLIVAENNMLAGLLTGAGSAISAVLGAHAQAPSAKNRVCVEVAHQPRFWGDPADMPGIDPKRVDRVTYMTGELARTATAVGASLSYVKSEITVEGLKGCDLLFIHIPSAKYTASEVGAVATYVTGGGSLFLVMDQDMWSTLEQTNVNDLIRPFGVQFGGESPDEQAGGHTNPGPVTDTRLKISYHGARTVTGGTPFAFNDRSDANPFGVFKEVGNGGRIIVMGDGMVSLYMTSWEGVQDYQCQEFMQAAFRWLLK